jgi:hypothetical protein
MAMAAKKPRSEKLSPVKTPLGSRKVEEINFFEYLKNKPERRYIEEVGVAAYLRKKRQPDAP